MPMGSFRRRLDHAGAHIHPDEKDRAGEHRDRDQLPVVRPHHGADQVGNHQPHKADEPLTATEEAVKGPL